MCFGHAAASGAVTTGVATELYLAYSIGAVCKHDESIRYFFRCVPFQWVDWEALVFFQAPRIIEKQLIDRWQTFREVHNFRKKHMEKKTFECSGKVSNPDRTETKVIIERFSGYRKSGNRVRKKWFEPIHR